ncbi:hypothetical protein HMPREF1549_02302 [Actinomyces johnsonii F0510]|uniref:Uncharacterized protein n=1 Tax=Actinomyces johnsonii F0510 TaxID=1227262 RepID=U1Q6V3_9ACTO|nr:hypothetical protein HMPREF1549_02302 [Actinomyces johnsonii F0510]
MLPPGGRGFLVRSGTYFSRENCVFPQTTEVRPQPSVGHRSPRSRSTFSTALEAAAA